MPLPLSIQNAFRDVYNGAPAARLRSASEAKNLETALRLHDRSFQTKIVKSKKTGREFVVVLLDDANGS